MNPAAPTPDDMVGRWREQTEASAAPVVGRAAELAATVRETLETAQEIHRVEATGVLPDFMPLAVALRNGPFAALSELEALAAETEALLAEKAGSMVFNFQAEQAARKAAEAENTRLRAAHKEIADTAQAALAAASSPRDPGKPTCYL